MLFFSTRSFRTFNFPVLDQIKVVARLALRDDFAAGGELDALEGVGDSLQSTTIETLEERYLLEEV